MTSIFGLGGNDRLSVWRETILLDGGTGSDRMEGGPGENTYYVDSPGDLIIEPADDDFRIMDTVFSSVSYTRAIA